MRKVTTYNVRLTHAEYLLFLKMKEDLKEFIKHLRSVHFVFVLAAVAIIMGLSGSNTIYEKALEQLRDVIRLQSVLTPKSISESIEHSANLSMYYAKKKNDNKLKVFIEESIIEYLEAIEMSCQKPT